MNGATYFALSMLVLVLLTAAGSILGGAARTRSRR